MSEKESQKSSWDTAVGIGAAILAFLVGRFFGFIGIGAVAVGWLVYEKSKEKLGRLIAVLAGVAVGLAVYGFAVVALIS
jgi:hypothetical protein